MRALLSSLSGDFRYATRTLRRAPLFTGVAVLSIAFGISANTAVFTLVDQVLLRTMPVRDPGALVQVTARGTESYGGGMGDGSELSYAMYRDLRDHNEVFAEMFCRFLWSVHLTAGGQSERVTAELVSGTFFPALGVRPSIGRLFTPDDDRTPGGHPVAVLGYGYWQARFGGDPAIVGRTVTVNGHPLQVIGVVGPAFTGLDLGRPVQVYVPIAMQPQMGPPWLELEGRRFRWVQVFARLRDGIGREEAAAGLQPLYRSILEREVTDAAFASASADTKRRFLEGRLTVDDASRGHSNLRESVTTPLLILMGIAGAVLLIVCANVANLLIARGASRTRELALRVAVGANRLRVTRLLLMESLVLAAGGVAVGLLLASWGSELLLAFYTSPETPIAVEANPDARILLFTSALGVLTAVLAGVVPAVRSTRLDLAPTLKGSGGAVMGEQPRLRKTLVVAQVALSFVLLICAGLFVRSLQNLLAVDPGFQTARTVSFSVSLGPGGYDGERARTFTRTLHERIARVGGVDAAGYAFQPLLAGGAWGMGLTVEGYEPPQGEGAGALCNAVSPGFFRAMGIPLLTGREFTDADDNTTAAKEGWPYRVAIVNETFARRYFNGDNPVGRHIGFGSDPGTPTLIRIVGLVKDSRYQAIREDDRAQAFFPYLQATIEDLTFYVRTRQDADSVMQAIRREVAALDPQLPVYGTATLEERIARSVVNERLIASLSAALSAMATLLSVIGLYGVMAYLVTRRTREFGIRIALGALGSQIARGVIREAGVLVAAGLVIGFGGAWWIGRYVESQLYGVAPADPATIAAAAAILTVVAVAAALFPARRAAGVSPISALRED